MNALERSTAALEKMDMLIAKLWVTPDDLEKLTAKSRELGLEDFKEYLARREQETYGGINEARAAIDLMECGILEGRR